VELEALLLLGEGEKLEFKKGPSDLCKEICAFANTEGGIIIVGVDDSGNIVGTDVRKVKDKVGECSQQLTPMPEIRLEVKEVEGRHIVLIEVMPSDKLVSHGGRAYIRVGTSVRPLDIWETLTYSVERGVLRWDEAPSGAAIEVHPFVEKVFRERLGHKVSLKDYLYGSGAAREGRFTFGGLLVFHPNPQRFLEHASVRIIQHPRAPKVEEIKGPIPVIVEDTLETLKSIFSPKEIVVGARRRRLDVFPWRAVREAVTNALIHRNYTIQAYVDIFIERGCVKVVNPGGLPPGADPEYPRHIPRNPLICRLMKDLGYIERFGYGFRMMKEEVQRYGNVEMMWENRPFSFSITFCYRGEDWLTESILTKFCRYIQLVFLHL